MKAIDHDDFNSWLTKIRSSYEEGEFQRVIDESRIWLQRSGEDFSIRTNCAANLIDAGSSLFDMDAIEDGIEIIRVALAGDLPSGYPFAINLKYNLANGYLSKYPIHLRKNNPSLANKALQDAKSILQELLLRKSNIERGLLSQILVNYANLLDNIGRCFEAFDLYKECIDLVPNQAIALGNCAITLKHIIPIFNDAATIHLYHTWELLVRANKLKSRALQLAGPKAVQTFTKNLAEIEDYIASNIDGGIEGLEEWHNHRLEVHGKPPAPEWLAKIAQDRLLLTYNLNPLPSVEECKDNIFFQSIVTDIKDREDRRFSILVNTLNAIKEDFITSRFLYYLHDSSKMTLAETGSITLFGNAMDYADFGLQGGILKASFRLSADCLDKIAVFLNEYLELGHKEDRVNFNNIWFEKLDVKSGLNPIIDVHIRQN